MSELFADVAFWQGHGSQPISAVSVPEVSLKHDFERHSAVMMTVSIAAMIVGSVWYSATARCRERSRFG